MLPGQRSRTLSAVPGLSGRRTRGHARNLPKSKELTCPRPKRGPVRDLSLPSMKSRRLATKGFMDGTRTWPRLRPQCDPGHTSERALAANTVADASTLMHVAREYRLEI